MRLADATVFWTPTYYPNGQPGVVVVRNTERRSAAAAPHRMWVPVGTGDGSPALGKTPEEHRVKRLALMMLDFHTLVVRDGLPPAEVHREFLKIDEYRAIISRDTPGADDGDGVEAI